ncbi:hypothetical protein Sjap_005549 [Stephania japonica]|uniref:5'-3' DNA helicase ZGRF1-like N-terminal domain-containing protein n=1 Tax=Stephania japonica TaxID=461633 RepID=A0AAP0PLZ2_9MAGN
MGEAKRRWSVTYTKHVKQKRKVHQDGSMEVCRSSNGVEKATLYDEPGNVMVSRYLKREERVECGGTLDLGSHLVDVGDLEGGFDGVEGKGDVKSSNSNSIGNEAAEREKTGVSRNCHTATEISAKEWYALYTTQITQKAKKYHDGILRLEFRGSHGKQVMLYDSTRKVLNTRFLKKDEVVRSGETLVFDAHLVDVGEPKENNEGAAGSTGGQQKQKILRDFKKEWHAMYTTQKTQKLKKYHDGILCLSVSICNQKQEGVSSFSSSFELDRSHGGDNRSKGISAAFTFPLDTERLKVLLWVKIEVHILSALMLTKELLMGMSS